LITIFSVSKTSNKAKPKAKRKSASLTPFEFDDTAFAEITELIAASRLRAFLICPHFPHGDITT